MAAQQLHLEIITQEKKVFDDQVDIVLAPAYEGQIGILPHHISLLTKLQSGELYIVKGPSMTILAITGGLLDVNDNKVTIMADDAVRADEIDMAKAEAAKRKAESALKEQLSERDFAVAQADLRKAILELKVVKKRRYRPQR